MAKERSKHSRSGKDLRSSGKVSNITPKDTSPGSIRVSGNGTGDYSVKPEIHPQSTRGNGGVTMKNPTPATTVSVHGVPAKASSVNGTIVGIAANANAFVEGGKGIEKIVDWRHENKMTPYKDEAQTWTDSAADKGKALKDVEERYGGIHGVFNELKGFSEKGTLSDDEKERVKELIAKLKQSLDSKMVSVALDEETGQITGLEKTIADNLQAEHEKKIKLQESRVKALQAASRKQSEVAENAGLDLGVAHVGGSKTANEALKKKKEIDKDLYDAMRELNQLKKQDPSKTYLQQEKERNEREKALFAQKEEATKRRRFEDDFNSETDAEKKIANRRQLIDAEKKKQAELQKQIEQAKAKVKERTDAKDEPGRIEAERTLLGLQNQMAGSEETVYGLERQIAQVRKPVNSTGSAEKGQGTTAESPVQVQGEVQMQGDGSGAATVRMKSPGTVLMEGTLQIQLPESAAPEETPKEDSDTMNLTMLRLLELGMPRTGVAGSGLPGNMVDTGIGAAGGLFTSPNLPEIDKPFTELVANAQKTFQNLDEIKSLMRTLNSTIERGGRI